MTICRINDENINGFLNVIKPEYMGDISVGAIDGDRAVGAAAYSYIESLGSLVLDYIYVDTDHRRQGFGKALVNDILEKTEAVAIHVNFPDSSEDLYGFFKKLGFALAPEDDIYNIPVKVFLNSELVQRAVRNKGKGRIVGLDGISDKQKKLLDDGILRSGVELSASEGADRSNSLSLVSINEENDSPQAAILCSRQADDIVVELLYSSANDPAVLSGLFKALYEVIDKEGLLEANLTFVTSVESIESLVQKMAGSAAKPVGMMVNGMLSPRI